MGGVDSSSRVEIDQISWLSQEKLEKLKSRGILPHMIITTLDQSGKSATRLWIKSLLSDRGDIEEVAGPPRDNFNGNSN